MTSIRDELRTVVREMLAKELYDSSWASLEVPEHCDGAGASFADLAVVCEEVGRAAASTPFFGTAVLAVGAAALLAPGEHADALFAAIGEGTTATVAFTRDVNAAAAGHPPFVLADGRVSGRAEFVPDAPSAERIVVVADASSGPVLAEIQTEVAPAATLDESRSFGAVLAEAVEPRWVAPFADPAGAVAALHDRAALALSLDSVGVAAAMLEATVDYARKRSQFGRPIGSFQAVQHACADMAVQLHVSRELVAGALEEGADGTAVAMAKAHATQTAVAIAGKAMQLHGGIGYTAESGIHRYLKRATLNRALLGSPAAHRRRLAARYA